MSASTSTSIHHPGSRFSPEASRWCSVVHGFSVVLLLAACSQTTPPSGQRAPTAAQDPVTISAPAGRYEMDPNHSTLQFRIGHLGLSHYVVRFTTFDVALKLDPANPSASSVEVTVDPTSVRTDYPGDYPANHPGSPFQSWDQDLAQSPKFFNAKQYPQITFKSTKVEQAEPGELRVTGDLTLLGKTHPVTLDATLVGSAAAHPVIQRGAIGFSATGTFNRSTFGMTHLLQPPLVGDAVTVQFEGEFYQAGAPGT